MTNHLRITVITTAIFIISCTVLAVDPVPTSKPSPEPLAGIENVWRISKELKSGGEPGGEVGLKFLKERGIKTIISVDGAKPDVELARRLGLRYAHIPIGYDSVPREKQLQLAQAFAQLPKPIYIHCHHGKHRGPAAAAIMARFGLGWSGDDATAFMQKAGTSRDYAGLYNSVSTFAAIDPKTVNDMKRPLPEIVDVPALVDLMVDIDNRHDHLKSWMSQALAPKADQKTAVSKIDPIQEAIQLRELVRESARLPECRDQPKLFADQFAQLESDLSRFIGQIKAANGAIHAIPETRKDLEFTLKSVAKRCVDCHKAFRDQKPKQP